MIIYLIHGVVGKSVNAEVNSRCAWSNGWDEALGNCIALE